MFELAPTPPSGAHRIALISDIHANLPALDAVLRDARSHGVDIVWNLGDSVGYGPFPNQTLDRLAEARALSILGNGDERILKFPKKVQSWKVEKRPEKYQAIRWTWREMTRQSRRQLNAMPRRLDLELAGRKALLVHGTAESNREPLYGDTPPARLRELMTLAPADLVVCGHSHEAFAREMPGTWFINPGSVGKQTDGDPRARYALLDISASGLSVRLRRVTFDISSVIDELKRHRLPEAVIASFARGRTLRWLRHQREATAS